MPTMNIISPPLRVPQKWPKSFIYALLLSLLLHITIVLALMLYTPEQQPEQRQPTFVRLISPPAVPKKQQQKPREFEIDQQPAEKQPPQPVESDRKADRDQKVNTEQAPKGDDVRDRTTNSVPSQPQLQPSPFQPAPPTKPSQPIKPATDKIEKANPAAALKKNQDKPLKPSQNKDEVESVLPHQPPAPALPQFTPEQLMPDRQTLDRIITAKPGQHSSIKKRDEVPIGDTIWLNLQHDLLVSFFRRFHDQVERVWNYPKEALERGQEGVLELLITVDQKGELLDVDLRRSSGSDILDYEAIQAIYRAAPFGPLGRHYPHERLNIRAYFHYSISGRYIYGQ